MTKPTPAPITAHEAASRRSVTARRIQVLAQQGRIPGAKKHGREWMIPADFTVTPATKRPKKMEKLLTPCRRTTSTKALRMPAVAPSSASRL